MGRARQGSIVIMINYIEFLKGINRNEAVQLSRAKLPEYKDGQKMSSIGPSNCVNSPTDIPQPEGKVYRPD